MNILAHKNSTDIQDRFPASLESEAGEGTPEKVGFQVQRPILKKILTAAVKLCTQLEPAASRSKWVGETDQHISAAQSASFSISEFRTSYCNTSMTLRP